MKAGNASYNSAEDVPEVIPVFPLTGALLLPGGQLPLNIFEPRYISMVNHALSGDRVIGMIQPCLKEKSPDADTPPLCKIGCLGRVTALQETGDGRYLINLSGICRYEIVEELPTNTCFRKCRIKTFEKEFCDNPANKEIDRDALLCAFRNYLDAHDMQADWDTVENSDNETLVTALCMMSPYGPAEKQALLEAPDLRSRADTLIAISEIHLAHNNEDGSSKLQ